MNYFNDSSRKITFNYNENNKPYSVIFPKGKYLIELYGASGGCQYGGKGGYTRGIMLLSKTKMLYLYIGGQGIAGNETSDTCLKGGFNGGGDACSVKRQCSGGGATDIRLTENSDYNERIIISGGGGGAAGSTSVTPKHYGGYGGKIGGTAYGDSGEYNIAFGLLYSLGGNQSQGGTASRIEECRNYKNENGTKGKGGNCVGGEWYCGGGGGGYYGGAGGFEVTGGGGGSSFIDSKYFSKGEMFNGDEKGIVGNGKIIVTYLSYRCTARINYGMRTLILFTLIIISGK